MEGRGRWIYDALSSIGVIAYVFTGSPELVPRVLDVIKSTLCYIVGTVYMEMKKKPNILEDVGRDVREKEIASLFVVNANLL